MTNRIHASTLSSISLAVVGLLAACSPPDNDGIPTTPPPAVVPNAAPPGGGPADSPIGVLPRSTDKQVIARAELRPTQGNTAMGTISFTRDGDTTMVQVALMGLTPGPHGIHIHENGDCSAPDASSAGEHFNPEGRPHGGLDTLPTERHPGDAASCGVIMATPPAPGAHLG